MHETIKARVSPRRRMKKEKEECNDKSSTRYRTIVDDDEQLKVWYLLPGRRAAGKVMTYQRAAAFLK